ncbi:3-hydroxybutyryl-CoA dehydrogenase [Thermoactinomyces sp. AMNI-1]|uniref:3-hydroxybutyryl-CoA dehydrogenase n=2 Tax=Thermoactinomyces mirandus TaxID=2756294 RepID=A0A7W2AQV7_9BACL|nr:3-hydroxybutyryl-CoA dehydrogenase [Thermoactinomyces mirandus]
MGIGIAEVFAAGGQDVKVVEISEQVFQNAMSGLKKRLQKRVERGKIRQEFAEKVLKRVRYVPDIRELVDADLVIEAIVEKLDVKQNIFHELAEVTSPNTILASNTSSLSITSIASAARHPERVMGIHFFNPASRMQLVEVVLGAETAPSLAEQVKRWLKELDKEPVIVKDTPGFLVNRIARPFHLEAYRYVQDQIASKEQVDRIMRTAGFRMGPFELQDLIGIDINFAASVSVFEGNFYDARYRPHPLQRQMVEQGAIGRKAGRGHYSYEK